MNHSEWLSFHLYYYENLLRPIMGFVRPVAVDLLQSGKIDHFFFIRYGLGGPHIRLRLQPLPERHEEVNARIEEQALEFLASSPSKSTRSREAIEKSTNSMLKSDPYETDGTIHPDNSFMAIPFRPETDRYGGPELLRASLDFFTISSLQALVFLGQHATAPRSRQLPWIFRLLFRQAIGFAANLEELSSLLRYAEISWGEKFPSIIEKADTVFERQGDTFISLLEEESRVCLGSSNERTSRPPLHEAACLLRHLTQGVGPDRRWVIGGSHLHMTANRLTASNPEEVYLSRLLFRAWSHLDTIKAPELALIGSGLDPAVTDTTEVAQWMRQRLVDMM